MDLLPGGAVTASALEAEKLRLQVVAENIANAHTTRTSEGGAYRRREVTFESVMMAANGQRMVGVPPERGVAVASIEEDESPLPVVYQPGHPHADADGYVQMPNVSLSREMVDLIAATRAYEANLVAAKAARAMAAQTLTLGRR